MTSESSTTELIGLLRQALEYVRYFGELGAETIDHAAPFESRTESVVGRASAKSIEPIRFKPVTDLETRTTTPPASLPPQIARAVPTSFRDALPQDSLFAVAAATGVAR